MSSYPGILPGWVVFSLDEPHPEPLAAIAGDSLRWQRSFEDYPANAGWTLTYALNNAAQRYLVASGDVAADGDGFTITIPSSETKTWVPGEYLWLAVLQNAATGARVTGAAGRITIQPDVLDATAPIDTRSQEEIALENVKATIAGRASDGVLEYKIGDRELRRYSMAELMSLKSYLSSEVKQQRIDRGETVLPETVAFHMDWGING
jgi:hypothetical protein